MSVRFLHSSSVACLRCGIYRTVVRSLRGRSLRCFSYDGSFLGHRWHPFKVRSNSRFALRPPAPPEAGVAGEGQAGAGQT